MKVTCYNENQLDAIVKKAYEDLALKKAVNITVEDYHKPSTLKQLGFWFSCICNSVKDFYHLKGDDTWTTEAVKDLFYQTLSPRVKMTRLNGDIIEHPLHLSEMNREQMSKFIDDSLKLIERANCFKGLVLHPSVRFCWVHNITPDDIRQIDTRLFSRKCPEYLEYVRGQCCLCCGQFGCEAHHIRETQEAGVARKADDWMTIPLCPEHHRAYHTKGSEWFKSQIHWILKYMTLEEFTMVNYNRWLNHF